MTLYNTSHEFEDMFKYIFAMQTKALLRQTKMAAGFSLTYFRVILYRTWGVSSTIVRFCVFFFFVFFLFVFFLCFFFFFFFFLRERRSRRRLRLCYRSYYDYLQLLQNKHSLASKTML